MLGHQADVLRQTLNEQPIVAVLHHSTVQANQTLDGLPNVNISSAVFDPIAQGQVINKLASEIQELKTRIEEISVQNERFFNKTILEQSNLTVKVP